MKALYLSRLHLTLHLFVFSVASSIACSCVWNVPDHFCRSVRVTDHIMMAVVVEIPHTYSMDVNVIEDINLTSNSDTISVLGQDGLNCGENIGNFEIGDTVILALSNGSTQDAQDGNSFEWSIGACGLYYLKYSNGVVEGDIDFGVASQSYENFKSGIMNCAELSSSTTDYLNKDDLRLLPNPANNFLDIFIENSNGSEYTFDILDISGTIVSSDILVKGLYRRVDLTAMSSGMYFLRTRSTLKVVTARFIKI